MFLSQLPVLTVAPGVPWLVDESLQFLLPSLPSHMALSLQVSSLLIRIPVILDV